MFRRDISLFKKDLRPMLITGVLMALVCIGAFFALVRTEKGTYNPVTIAVVNEDEGTLFGDFAISAVTENETVKLLAEVRMYDCEEEAFEAVRKGAAAAVIIPKGFFDSVNSGTNEPCRLILNDELSMMAGNVEIFAELGSDILTESQRWIFAGDAYLAANNVSSDERNSCNLVLNSKMLGSAASAESTYLTEEVIPYTSGGLSLVPHYFILYFIFLLGIICISLSALYHTDMNRALLARLKVCGAGEFGFFKYKMLITFVLFTALFAAASAAAVKLSGIEINAAAIPLALAAIAFITVFTGALSMGMGRMSGGAIFMIFLLGLFFCGGMIPYSSMADAALTFGKFTPVGAAYALLAPMFGGKVEIYEIFVCAAYTAAACFFLHFRYRDIISGRAAS